MPKHKYNVKVEPSALELLERHIAFLSNISTNAARKLKVLIMAKIKTLRDNPFQYPIWQVSFDLPHEYRRIVVNKRYLIIYFIDGTNVFVDYIFDSGMDNSKLL